MANPMANIPTQPMRMVDSKLDDVKPERYMATVEHPGLVQSASGKRPASILVQPRQDTTDLVFYMQPAAVITGKVADLDGDPMSNVGISALRVGSALRGINFHDSGSAVTNDLGNSHPRSEGGAIHDYRESATRTSGATRRIKGQGEGKSDLYHHLLPPGALDKEQSVAVEVHPGDETPVNFEVLASPAYRAPARW